MLKKLSLENFKAFSHLDQLEFKPVTILCGANSSGKSSILQSILLFKQSFENQKEGQNLLLNGRFVKLGSFVDAIHNKEKDKQVSFEFQFEGTDIETGGIVKIEYKVSFSSVIDRQKGERLIIDRIHGEVKGDEEEPIAKVSLRGLGEDVYDVTFYSESERHLQSKFDIENFLPKLSIKSINGEGKDLSLLLGISNVLKEINVLFNVVLSDCNYIGPLRKSHTGGGGFYFGDDISEIGNSGENAPFLYLKEKNKELLNHHFYNEKDDSFTKKESTTLEKALGEWFTTMGIQGFEGTITNRIINLQLDASKYAETKIDVSQVGFGVSQMFPILLEGLRMEEGETLLLEQPEIHLHPNLQMKMADYFLALAKSNKQVIVETHSDHVINRLVRRIVEDDTDQLKDLIKIYFIKQSESGSTIEEVEIDSSRGIVNWPPDFFDQAATEQMRIMQAGLKKRKTQRANR